MFTRRGRTTDPDRLREVGLFQGCTDEELHRVEQLTTTVEVPAATVLCQQGKFGTESFVVLRGEADVAIDGVAIASLGPGSFFGEMSILDGNPRVASVTARTSMTVLVSTPQELELMLRDVPPVARRMMSAMSARLRLADRALARS